MLPLVLGGIALAAVGYGVKEYCESEGCPWDEEPSHTPINIFESLHQQKLELSERKLLHLKQLLWKMENIDKKLQLMDVVIIEHEKLLSSELEDDVKLYSDMYSNILTSSVRLVDGYAHTVEALLAKETDYNHLNKSEKKCVKKAYKVVNTIEKLIGLRLLDDKVLNVEVIPLLKKYKSNIDTLTHEYAKRAF